MDKVSPIGELLEKGQSNLTQTVTDVTNSVKSQVIGDQKDPLSQAPRISLGDGPVPVEDPQISAQRTKAVVSDFYAPSSETVQAPPQTNEGTDEQKLTKVRQELLTEQEKHQALHEEVYYNPLFAYEQRKGQQEERPAETAQRQQMEDLQKKHEQKAKTDADIATQRAQHHVEIRASAG
ncbi:MAG: hypothetical protein HY344_01055 [Candidatus Levybacteria bacterium]|nr:hypothetical protein [Candidatus Levybacteria bacterium]